jgi:nucleoside phosphorylase
MSDAVLERITLVAEHAPLAAIPWPEGSAPTHQQYNSDPDQPMPAADVLVVTWTAAEAQALADVMTPGLASRSWQPYARNWSEYEPQLTDRSPARDEHCMAHYALCTIGSTKVVVAKSELHLATDGPSAPIIALWRQMVGDVSPGLVITTGTAGGIGATTQLGDVFCVTTARFNCTQAFKDKPWAQERYGGPALTGGRHANLFPTLVAPNAGQLRPVASRDPVLSFGGDVETVDLFAFANTTDSFGLVHDDPDAHSVEMDDATLPLALATISTAPRWCSVRNASDPEVSSSIGDLEAQKAWAAKIYAEYGYWTTVASAIACWTVITDRHHRTTGA